MSHIGEKIYQLRTERKISRPVFCDDESTLSIRQLVRIENGESSPSIATATYIAERLGIPVYQLMPDYQELPAIYIELKYIVLRQPVYGNREILEQHEEYLNEIIVHFYPELPSDEQFAIDCMEATVQMCLASDVDYATAIVDDSIINITDTDYFSVNDLIYLRLLAGVLQTSSITKQTVPPNYITTLNICFEKLLKQSQMFSLNDLFIYSNFIFSYLSYCNRMSNYSKYQESIEVLKEVLEKIQDFQKSLYSQC